MKYKHCRDCDTDLPLTAFTRNRRSRDGLSFYCAVCSRRRVIESRRRRLGPPKSRHGQGPADVPTGHKWCPECDQVLLLASFAPNTAQANGVNPYCTPCFNAIKERNRQKIHGSTRNYHLKHRYGITVDEFDEMLAVQDGVCAICREAPAEHVDHCHATDRVRGLLCFNCNGALGQFRDRPDLMLLAVHYLERGAAATYTRPPAARVGFALGFDEDENPRPPGEPPDVAPGLIA